MTVMAKRKYKQTQMVHLLASSCK